MRQPSEWLLERKRQRVEPPHNCATERSRHRMIRPPPTRDFIRSSSAIGDHTRAVIAALREAFRRTRSIACEQHALKSIGAKHFSQVHSPRPEGPGSDPPKGRCFHPPLDTLGRIAEIHPFRHRPRPDGWRHGGNALRFGRCPDPSLAAGSRCSTASPMRDVEGVMFDRSWRCARTWRLPGIRPARLIHCWIGARSIGVPVFRSRDALTPEAEPRAAHTWVPRPFPVPALLSSRPPRSPDTAPAHFDSDRKVIHRSR